MFVDPQDIVHIFTNQPPQSPAVHETLDLLTRQFIALGQTLAAHLPAGDEADYALYSLRQCSQWAKDAVCLNQLG